MSWDLLLSSGYLAFARQAGFLRAVEEAGLQVDAVVGTSSGALAGALWCAGLDATAVLAELTGRAPLWDLRPSPAPWEGLFTTQAAARRLARLVPERIEQLARPFAVGLMRADGGHHLLTSGPLVPALLASAAVPRLIRPVPVDGVPYRDGGFTDRLGTTAWRSWRPGRAGLAHLVDRSSGAPEGELEGLVVVRTPRSQARLWDLGPVQAQFAEARALTHAVLADLEGTSHPHATR